VSNTLRDRDETHLNLLSLFHNLVAVLWVLVALFPVVYLGTGMDIVRGRFDGVGIEDLSRSFGWSVVVWSTASIAVSLGMAVLTFLAGIRLTQRRARSFCSTVAAINCFFFPFGTVLGVLTIVVLKRPSVRSTFRTKPRHANVAAWEDTRLP